jgi:Permuted papain-like amidase enzyme, YaeF/YiiX, C92 family
MLIRWATLGLVLGGLVGHAFAAGQRLQVEAAKETVVPAAGGDPAERINDVGRTDVSPGAIDLTKDADGDGLPDELETGVDAARAIASGGDPNQLDDDELDPFAAVIMDLADRLPLSARTRKDQRHILELTAELNTAGPRKARRILRRIGRREGELLKDPNLELVMKSLDQMLGPATADDGTAAGIPAAVVPTRRPAPTGKPAFEQLQRGDVMLLRSRGSFLFPWTVYYSHAGTYDGNNMVYESLGSGVQLGPLQHWKERGTRVALGRSTKSSQPQVVAALDQAKSRYGTNKKTPYNFLFPNKTRDDAIYCSQLTWKIHKSLGVDLDSNDWRWFLQVGLKNIYATPVGIGTLIPTVLIPAVAPDEVYYSPNVSFYSQGDN